MDARTTTFVGQPASDREVGLKDDTIPFLAVFPCLMDIGEAMLKCGADVHTIEQMLVRLGKSYGAERMNVLVITALIVVTVTYPDNYERTFSRRVVGEGGTDFAKLEALSDLCEECYRSPMTAEEITRRLEAIKRRAFPDVALFVGGALSAGGFAVFFGGTVVDGLVSALFALAVCLVIKHLKPLTPNTIIFNFATSLVAGLAICFVAGVVPEYDVNVVIIGVIMLLIPGVAMTNATRDMLSGDTISGVMRFIESLLWATSLALGFMAALWAASGAGWASGRAGTAENWPFVVMLPVVLISSLGFALFFNVRPRHMFAATLGGALTWMIFFAFDAYIPGPFVPCLIAGTFAAVYAEVLARRHKIPNAVFFIIAVIPLVPGRGLYYTMYSAVNGDWAACSSYALSTLMYAAGIAAGICLIAGIMQTWDMWKAEHEKSAAVIIGAEKKVVSASRKIAGAVKPSKPVKPVASATEPERKREKRGEGSRNDGPGR